MASKSFRFLLLLAGLACFLAAPARADEQEGCIMCHSDEDMEPRLRAPAVAFEAADVHARAGLSCTACHGGKDGTMDFSDAHSKKSGFRGKVPQADVVAVCAGCHDDQKKAGRAWKPEDSMPPGVAFRQSVHGQVHAVENLELPTCISCHGAHGILPPDDPKSKVYVRNVPETCARCHADLDYMRAFTSAAVPIDQLAAYRTSTHGKRLAQGDTKVAVCSSCHGHHDILKPTDPKSKVYPTNVSATCGACHSDKERMKDYRIPAHGGGERPLPTDQEALYDQSIHHEMLVDKGDLSAPTCNDCHGNHGATPPQVRAVANVCGQCHSRPADLFDKTSLAVSLNDEGWPACATCHGNHKIVRPDDAFLATIARGEKTPGGWTPDPKIQASASKILDDIQTLSRQIDETKALVDRVANYGMDVTRATLRIQQARDRLVQARVSVHTYDPKVLDGILHGTPDQDGGLVLADQAHQIALDLLAERRFRRWGLVVALAIIALVVVVLVVKIRRMERRKAVVRT